jgi:hypothetical protein
MLFVFFYTLFAIKHNFITWFFTFYINHTKMLETVLMLVVVDVDLATMTKMRQNFLGQ